MRASAVFAIFVTIGIVPAAFRDTRFFESVNVLIFYLEFYWSPQMAVEADKLDHQVVLGQYQFLLGRC